jgi:hypothetical protein
VASKAATASLARRVQREVEAAKTLREQLRSTHHNDYNNDDTAAHTT